MLAFHFTGPFEALSSTSNDVPTLFEFGPLPSGSFLYAAVGLSGTVLIVGLGASTMTLIFKVDFPAAFSAVMVIVSFLTAFLGVPAMRIEYFAPAAACIVLAATD